MKTKKKWPLAFYQNLGKLFYAIAGIDNNVHPDEVKKLQDCVQNIWLDLDDLVDEFGEDAAYQIEVVFNWMESQVEDAQESYETFVTYYRDNEHFFTPEIKEIVEKTTRAIAASFAGFNKSELGLMAKLSILLNQNS